ncbi:MAG: ankyrin repeat domain-containing protein [Saprospiraceae bacterium]|nr:ankyrin repeat domain-containing protein [Saprospiraceae bacterium]
MSYRPIFANKTFAFALLLVGASWLMCCQKNDPTIKMFEAIKNVDIEEVQEAIEDGAQKNALNKSGEHAFHVALKTGNRNLVEALIRSGFNLNIPDTLGFTPVFRCHDPIILKILLSAGASIDITDSVDKKTPLMLVERADCASILILHSPDILDKQDKSGKTALIYAILNNQARVIDTLLKYDARVDIFDNDGKNSMDYAKQEKLLNRLKEKDKIQNTEIKSIIDYRNSTSIIPFANFKYREKFTIPPKTYKLIIHYETTSEMSSDFLEFANKVSQLTPTGQLIELAENILTKFHTKSESKSETGNQSVKYYLTTPANAEAWYRMNTISFGKQQKLEDFSFENRDCKSRQTHEWPIEKESSVPTELSICLERCDVLNVATSSCNIRIGVIAYVFQPKNNPTPQIGRTILPSKLSTHPKNICTMGGKSAFIRDKPSLVGKKLGTIKRGDTLKYFEKTQPVALPNGKSNGAWPWVKIETQKGKIGWVYGEFLIFDE